MKEHVGPPKSSANPKEYYVIYVGPFSNFLREFQANGSLNKLRSQVLLLQNRNATFQTTQVWIHLVWMDHKRERDNMKERVLEVDRKPVQIGT